MKVLFIAGFGPITSNVMESRRLYEDALGIRFKVEEGGCSCVTVPSRGARS